MILNGVRWSICLVAPSHSILLTPWGTRALGVCDKKTNIIYIDKTLKKKKLKKVLCHEIVHASIFSYNIDLSFEEEERLAELITNYGEEIIKQTNKLYNKIQ
jgi:hypothetical protein